MFELPDDANRDDVNKILSSNPVIADKLGKIVAAAGTTEEALGAIAADPGFMEQLAMAFGPQWQQRLVQYAENRNPKRLAEKQALLESTNYGRCVYRSDNDQPDHYVTNIRFKGGVTASFSMEAFTSYHGRRTRIMGSLGDIVGDMDGMVHTDFNTGKKTSWEPPLTTSGHGGGDFGLVFQWIHAVSGGDRKLLTSTIDDSIESHVMAFDAEADRLASL